MSNTCWTKFELQIKLAATPLTLYNCWATQKGMEYWFLRQCHYYRNEKLLNPEEAAKVGDSYAWLWHGWADDVEEKGEILEADGHSSFTFRFGSAGKVKIQLQPTEERITLLTLTQYDIPTTDEGRYNWHVGCKTGWTFYLTNLKAMLEHQVDLRNRELGIANVVNG